MTDRPISAPRASAFASAPPAWLIGFLLVLTAARLVAAAAIPLTEDEAYYRLWAQTLQLGYYDHPPMIAWWIRAGMSLAGDDPLGVRLVPTLATGLTGLVIYDLALGLGADRAIAARASVWYNATLLIGMGGALAAPDVAATPFWALTLWCLAKTGGARDGVWWLAAGAAAGLACLSKYSSLFIAPGVFIWLLMTAAGRASLRRPWPWAAAVVAAALFGLNLAWNAEHHWVTFDKQFSRLTPHGLRPQFLAELIAGQFLLLNPLIAIFAIRGLGASARDCGKAGGFDGRILLATSTPFVAYLMLHSLHDRVQAHWPAPVYPAMALIAATAASNVPVRGAMARMRGWAAPLGLTLSALALAHVALPATDIAGLNDPTGALRGWPDFARSVDQLRRAHGAGWIGTLSYGVTGQLDAQRIAAPVVELGERDRYLPGDGSWRANTTAPGLVVDLKRRMKDAGLLRDCFAEVTPLGDLVRHQGASRHDRYSLFLVGGPRDDVLTKGCPGLAAHKGL